MDCLPSGLLPVTGPALRQRLTTAVVQAAHTQTQTPGYLAELQLWTRRPAGGRDGVPIGSVPPPPVGLIEPSSLRHFPPAGWVNPASYPGTAQALEVDVTRKELQHQVLHIPEHPQLIIRIGWPATAAAELPPTPRRSLRSVVLPAP